MTTYPVGMAVGIVPARQVRCSHLNTRSGSFTFPRAHFIGRSKPHRLISKIFTHVFACAGFFDGILAGSFAVWQSKAILARHRRTTSDVLSLPLLVGNF